MNARELGRLVQGQLEAAAIPGAAFEAEYLVRSVTGLNRATYFTGSAVAGRALAEVQGAVARRLHREPAAYITGTREFFGLAFAVTNAVLIPRPESELMVEAALAALGEHPRARVADIGTGSGCIAIAVAANAPGARVTGIDRSASALRVAAMNARTHAAPVTFVQGDLLGPVGAADIVLANLPYIPSGDIAGLQPEVRDWEPRVALDGGHDGLTVVRRLIRDCADRVRPRLLALEVGAGQAAAVACLCTRAGAAVEVVPDLSGIERMVVARWR